MRYVLALCLLAGCAGTFPAPPEAPDGVRLEQRGRHVTVTNGTRHPVAVRVDCGMDSEWAFTIPGRTVQGVLLDDAGARCVLR